MTRRRKRKIKETSSISAKEIALHCVAIADDKKAEDILVLDIRKITFLADYFVICTGFNSRQLQTIADEISKTMKDAGVHPVGAAGYNEAMWILLDYGEVVVHLFDAEARAMYKLEDLWSSAKRVRWRAVLAKRKQASGPPSGTDNESACL
ncbi:MAG: ribosome silencing factor [Planctomycetota bacterium]